MKNILKLFRTIMLTTALFLFEIQLNYAQWTQTSPGTGQVIYFDPAIGTASAVGIGDFSATNPSSYLHVNSNLQPATNSNFGLGETFRADCPSGVDHRWRMFTNGSEIFRIENPSGAANVSLRGLGNGTMRLWTNDASRLFIDNGSGAASGYVGIGNSFVSPVSRLHLFQGTDDTWFQITNTGTGGSTGDGLRIGVIDAAPYNVEIRQQEPADMLFHTSATERMRILSGGNVGIGTSSINSKLTLYNDYAVSATAQAMDITATGTAANLIGLKAVITATGGTTGQTNKGFYPPTYI